MKIPREIPRVRPRYAPVTALRANHGDVTRQLRRYARQSFPRFDRGRLYASEHRLTFIIGRIVDHARRGATRESRGSRTRIAGVCITTRYYRTYARTYIEF